MKTTKLFISIILFCALLLFGAYAYSGSEAELEKTYTKRADRMNESMQNALDARDEYWRLEEQFEKVVCELSTKKLKRIINEEDGFDETLANKIIDKCPEVPKWLSSNNSFWALPMLMKLDEHNAGGSTRDNPVE